MITTYTYDAGGNRTRLNVDGALTTYVYDAGNRMRRSEEINGITTFTFDNNGNQRRVESPTNELTTYSWTYENQLKVVENPDGELTTYTWAPSNRRGVELRIAKETELFLTNYLWDDQRLLMETDEVGAVEAEYTLQPMAYGPLVSQRRASESSFYAFDALGSTAALTDDTQAITDEYTYKPFGEVRSSSGTTQNPFQWVGQQGYYYEGESDFYSVRRRGYGPNQGRWLSADPLRFGSGDSNFYRYVRNDPVNVADPKGTEPIAGRFQNPFGANCIDCHPDPNRPAPSLRTQPSFDFCEAFGICDPEETRTRIELPDWFPELNSDCNYSSLNEEELNKLGEWLAGLTRDQVDDVLDEMDLRISECLAEKGRAAADAAARLAEEERRAQEAAEAAEWERRKNFALAGASCIPYVGEAMDVATLCNSNEPWWSRGLAGVSLGFNAFTGGLAPNWGGVRRGAKAIDPPTPVIPPSRSPGAVQEPHVGGATRPPAEAKPASSRDVTGGSSGGSNPGGSNSSMSSGGQPTPRGGCLEPEPIDPNRIYSARELIRRYEEPGPFHNFPETFNTDIFRGNRQIISEDYILYTQRGCINGVEGTFEIGVRPSISGRNEVIVHRFFRPDPRR